MRWYGRPAVDRRLASEKVVVQSPLSYSGATQRIWGLTRRPNNPWIRVTVQAVAALLVALAWVVVTGWYVVFLCFFIVAVPYRLLRRSTRKRKADQQRHREMLNAVNETR